MAIFGVREIGTEIDVATIQVTNNRMRKSNAKKVVRTMQESKSSVNIRADKQYEVHLLFVE